MKIAIAGGSGFVGKALADEFVKQNHVVVILTRHVVAQKMSEQIRYVEWLTETANPIPDLEDTDIFINLAGESISSGRWTANRKEKIGNSRIKAVKEMTDIINKLGRKPRALINASAIGIYGTSLEKVFTEKEDDGLGNDFLAKTVRQWEKEVDKVSQLGIRTVFCRFGIILDKQQGALPKMVIPYKSFIGGSLGNGRQWMSWIHIDDVIKGISYIIENDGIQGPINFTAPQPVTMNEFGHILAQVLHRPHWLPIPRFTLRLLLGEMSTLVVDGQKVLPDRLINSGYHFKYPELYHALKNIFS